MTLTQKKLGNQNIGNASKPTRKKTTSVAKKKGCGKEKDTIFLAACIIEAAQLISTKLGREVEDVGFKITYERLKKLYKEVK